MEESMQQQAEAEVVFDKGHEREADDEGFRKHYDVILNSTGLMESIVACSMARAGKTVLHLDKNDYYGRECSSTNLEGFLSESRALFSGKKLEESEKEEDQEGIDVEKRAATSARFEGHESLEFDNESSSSRRGRRVIDFGDIVGSATSSKGGVNVNNNFKSASVHVCCRGYVMEKCGSSGGEAVLCEQKSCHPAFFGYIQDHRMTGIRALAKSRTFSIDTSCRLVLGSGSAVDCMISSGIARHLEFKSLEGIYFLNPSTHEMSPVPCCKGDIFTSKLLNALEKRSLMKFLQAVVDHGLEEFQGGSVSTLNERELAQGRSLRRPQNKDQNKATSSSFSLSGALKEEGDFKAYMDTYKLSPRLQAIVVHALCLYEGNFENQSATSSSSALDIYPARDGMYALYKHINALGRFGKTAFLTAIYGSAELPQSFCRMSAVWGGTYVLRRSVRRLFYAPSSSLEQRQQQGRKVMAVEDSTGRVFTCGAFVCNAEDWPQGTMVQSSSFIVCRVSVCTSSVLPQGLSLAVIPPRTNSLNNEHAVYVYQMDSSVQVAPEGLFLVYSVTTVDNYVSDDSSSVQETALLMTNVMTLLQSTNTSAPFLELCFATSVRPLYQQQLLLGGHGDDILAENVALCGETCLDLQIDGLFERAKSLFSKLFPDEEFLPSQEQSDEGGGGGGREEGNGEDEDGDEEAYLESVLRSAKREQDI